MRKNNLKIGFYKSTQGVFDEQNIGQIKRSIEAEIGATVIEVDFREGVLINGNVYVGDVCINSLDLYFWHDTIWPGKTGSDSYYINLLRAIGNDCKVINTADSVERVNDKLRSHETLRKAGLPVSEFALVYSDSKSNIERAFNKLGRDVLIKPRFGGWGKGIVRIRSIEDLQDVIELGVSVAQREQQYLIERYYENNLSDWISVSMIGQKPIIGYRKSVSIGGSTWKIYDPNKVDGRGEMSEYVRPSEEVCALASRAQAALGKDIVGFDFIKTESGYVIVDENARPGLYKHCLEKANIDIVQEVVELVRSKL